MVHGHHNELLTAHFIVHGQQQCTVHSAQCTAHSNSNSSGKFAPAHQCAQKYSGFLQVLNINCVSILIDPGWTLLKKITNSLYICMFIYLFLWQEEKTVALWRCANRMYQKVLENNSSRLVDERGSEQCRTSLIIYKHGLRKGTREEQSINSWDHWDLRWYGQ